MRNPSFVLGTLLSPLRPTDLSTTSACCIRIYFVSMTSFSITSPALEATHPQKKKKNNKPANNKIFTLVARDDVTTSCHYVQYTKPTQPQKDIFTTRVRSAMSNTTSLFAPLRPAFFLLVASGGATFL